MKTIKNEIINKADKAIAKTYNRLPIVITKGKGCTLWDSKGRSYTDFVAGIAVCNLGHAHPRIAKAINRLKYFFMFLRLYYTVPRQSLHHGSLTTVLQTEFFSVIAELKQMKRL